MKKPKRIKYLISILLILIALITISYMNKNDELEGRHIITGFRSIHTFYFEPKTEVEKKGLVIFDALNGTTHLECKFYELGDDETYRFLTKKSAGSQGEGFRNFIEMNISPGVKYKVTLQIKEWWKILEYLDVKIDWS